MRWRSLSGAAGALVATGVLFTASAAFAAQGSWPNAGHDLSNSRSADSTIGVGGAPKLAVKWKVPTAGNISATPAVVNGVVYVPDDAGNLYAIDAATHATIWQKNLSADYGAPPGDYSRATPAVSGNTLVFGDQAGKVFSPDGWVYAVDKRNGGLLWKTTIAGGYPIITQSATIVGNTVYIGAASNEELLARFGFPLTFRGFFMALDLTTGAVKWKTYMAPAGYTGAAVWGSSPAVDSKRGTVYIATGNNYSIPDAVTACVAAATSDPQRAACVPADDMFDAIVALDMNTGAVKWSTRALPVDAWNVACGIPVPGYDDPVEGCPTNAGPDYDFAQAPMLWKAGGRELVGAGQKSGIFWALDPDTGAVVWKTQAAPGGLAGGLQWGSATDGVRIYVASANTDRKPWTLLDGTTVNYGGWAALDAATGRVIWNRANPAAATASGAVTVAAGVVYACSGDTAGHMYAMKASDGTQLWDHASGDFCYSGAAAVDGALYWGTGYNLGFELPGQALYAFSVSGK
nr:PQQ-binding-like beta-propeller repeat protein [Nocardioides sp. MAH-18]